MTFQRPYASLFNVECACLLHQLIDFSRPAFHLRAVVMVVVRLIPMAGVASSSSCGVFYFCVDYSHLHFM